MLDLIGLIMGFIGALLLLIDPTTRIFDDFTKGFIQDRESVFTIPQYDEATRRKIIVQIWLRRLGVVMVAMGFFSQLLSHLCPSL